MARPRRFRAMRKQTPNRRFLLYSLGPSRPQPLGPCASGPNSPHPRPSAPSADSTFQLEFHLNSKERAPVFDPANAENSQNSALFSHPLFFLNYSTFPRRAARWPFKPVPPCSTKQKNHSPSAPICVHLRIRRLPIPHSDFRIPHCDVPLVSARFHKKTTTYPRSTHRPNLNP